jgi:hypothetical protein
VLELVSKPVVEPVVEPTVELVVGFVVGLVAELVLEPIVEFKLVAVLEVETGVPDAKDEETMVDGEFELVVLRRLFVVDPPIFGLDANVEEVDEELELPQDSAPELCEVVVKISDLVEVMAGAKRDVILAEDAELVELAGLVGDVVDVEPVEDVEVVEMIELLEGAAGVAAVELVRDTELEDSVESTELDDDAASIVELDITAAGDVVLSKR